MISREIGSFLGRPPVGASCRPGPAGAPWPAGLLGGLQHQCRGGEQFQKQSVHPVLVLRPGPGDLVPAVAEYPQHHQVRIGGQLP
jgi:hypothetical protein